MMFTRKRKTPERPQRCPQCGNESRRWLTPGGRWACYCATCPVTMFTHSRGKHDKRPQRCLRHGVEACSCESAPSGELAALDSAMAAAGITDLAADDTPEQAADLADAERAYLSHGLTLICYEAAVSAILASPKARQRLAAFAESGVPDDDRTAILSAQSHKRDMRTEQEIVARAADGLGHPRHTRWRRDNGRVVNVNHGNLITIEPRPNDPSWFDVEVSTFDGLTSGQAKYRRLRPDNAEARKLASYRPTGTDGPGGYLTAGARVTPRAAGPNLSVDVPLRFGWNSGATAITEDAIRSVTHRTPTGVDKTGPHMPECF